MREIAEIKINRVGRPRRETPRSWPYSSRKRSQFRECLLLRRSFTGQEANVNTTKRNSAMPDQNFTMTIDGKAITGAATYTIINPANGQVIASAPDCSRDELEQAVTAARAAFPDWAARPIGARFIRPTP
jgi:delta 1-pyrroline-5-carboxylate dehydrogenase